MSRDLKVVPERYSNVKPETILSYSQDFYTLSNFIHIPQDVMQIFPPPHKFPSLYILHKL